MRKDGALTATAGTVIGSLVLGGLGASLMLLPCKGDGLDCLGPFILGIFAAMGGFVLGSLIGCYVALHQRNHARAGATVLVLMGLGAVVGFGSLGLALAGLGQPAFVIVAAGSWLGLPFLARRVVVRAWIEGRSRRSDAAVDI